MHSDFSRAGPGLAPARLFLLASVFFGSALAYWLIAGVPLAASNVFQARDLERAAQFFQGRWLFHGPELMGGGTLPGPLYYLLLVLPASSPFPWSASVIQTFAFAAAGVSLLATWSWRNWGWTPALLAFLGLTLSGHVLGELRPNWNASLSVFFHSICVIALCEAWTAIGTRQALRWAFFLGVLTGLSVQIHMTAVIPAIAFIALTLFRRERGLMSLWVRLALGFAIPILPWILWRIPEHADQPLFPLKQLARNASITFKVGFSIPDWAEYQFRRSAIAALCLAVAVLLKRSSRDRIDPRIQALAAVALLGLFVHIPWLASHQLDRYSGMFQRTLALTCAILAGQALQSRARPIRSQALLFTALFALIPVGLELQAGKYGTLVPGYQHRSDLYLIQGDDARDAAKTIIRQTGWTWEQAKTRLFTLGIHHESDLSMPFREANAAAHVTDGTRADIAGYFLVQFPPAFPNIRDSKPVQSARDLPDFLEDLIAAETIRLEAPIPVSPWLRLVPYTASPDFPFPEGVHNVKLSPAPEVPPRKFFAPGAASSWDLCKSVEASCPVYFQVQEHAFSPTHRKIEITLTGNSISRNSPWETFDWVEQYEMPYIRGTCDGKSRDLILADQLGSHIWPTAPRERVLLGPFKRVFVIPCKGRWSLKGAGYLSRRAKQDPTLIEEGPAFHALPPAQPF